MCAGTETSLVVSGAQNFVWGSPVLQMLRNGGGACCCCFQKLEGLVCITGECNCSSCFVPGRGIVILQSSIQHQCNVALDCGVKTSEKLHYNWPPICVPSLLNQLFEPVNVFINWTLALMILAWFELIHCISGLMQGVEVLAKGFREGLPICIQWCAIFCFMSECTSGEHCCSSSFHVGHFPQNQQSLIWEITCTYIQVKVAWLQEDTTIHMIAIKSWRLCWLSHLLQGYANMTGEPSHQSSSGGLQGIQPHLQIFLFLSLSQQLLFYTCQVVQNFLSRWQVHGKW